MTSTRESFDTSTHERRRAIALALSEAGISRLINERTQELTENAKASGRLEALSQRAGAEALCQRAGLRPA